MSQHCCDFLVLAVGLEELAHAKQAGAGETTEIRMLPLDVDGEFRHHPLAPDGGFELLGDKFTHAPIKIDRLGVDGMKSALPGSFDQGQHFTKCGFVRDASGGALPARACPQESRRKYTLIASHCQGSSQTVFHFFRRDGRERAGSTVRHGGSRRCHR